jgi:hypothetical protein
MRLLLLHIILLLTSFTLTAQPITWQRTYGDSNIDYGYSIVQTPDSGYIAVGRKRVGTNNYAIAIRLNSFGDTVWTKLYYSVEARKILRTSDGNYVITTSSLMDKIDIDGNLIWQVPVFSEKVVQGLDGELLAIQDLILRKYSSNGIIVWSKDFSKTINGHFVDIAVNSANELVLVGNLNNSTTDNRFVLRTNLGGTEISRTKFFWNVNPAYVIPVAKNGFVLSGSRTPRLALFDSTGSIVWDSSYSVSLPEYFETFHTIKTFNGGYALAGYYRNGDYDYYINLLKIDFDGRKSWSRVYGFGDHDEGQYVQQTSDSGFIIIGFRDNFNLGDIYVIKTDKTGYASPPLAINNPEYEETVGGFRLYPSYPNPFNSTTKIRFYIPISTIVSIKVIDLNGKLVAKIAEKKFDFGEHVFEFSTSGLSSGLYLCVMHTPNASKTIKLLLTK